MSPRGKAVMVRTFCTGSLDKDAGLHAANQQPEPLNGAIVTFYGPSLSVETYMVRRI